MQPKARVLVFVVSYNAEAFIGSVLNRIPSHVWDNEDYAIEVLVIDDRSSDSTFYRVIHFVEQNPQLKIKVLYNPMNQGYGGNQKLGYHYAIEQGFEVVVLLHGDGQYAPEYLDQMISPIVAGEAEVVLGSRMIHRLNALRGGMPLYKWIGNQILTLVQNKALGSHLSEFHTGYRAYSIRALMEIPFEYNSNYFDFDTDILIQMLDTRQRIKELEIPTYYGDEVSYVNGLRYAWLVLWTTFRSRIAKWHLLYDLRFDYDNGIRDYYTPKWGYPSSHQFAIGHVRSGMTVLDVGCGAGYMAKEIHARGARVVSVDRQITETTREFSTQTIQADVDDLDFKEVSEQIDLVFLLDIVELLRDPERVLMRLRNRLARDRPPKVIVTSGNIAFFVTRFGLLLGKFNYGKKGILDRDHRRLFTFGSMKQLLDSSGYDILQIRGIPAPYPEAIGRNSVSRLLVALNLFLIRVSRGLFSYQMAFVVRPRPMAAHLLEHANHASWNMVRKRAWAQVDRAYMSVMGHAQESE
jgi:glycosyltransferase involved in cell wall biosynthesis